MPDNRVAMVAGAGLARVHKGRAAVQWVSSDVMGCDECRG